MELKILKSMKKTLRTESGAMLDEFAQGSIASQLRGSLDQGKRKEKRHRRGRLPMLIKHAAAGAHQSSHEVAQEGNRLGDGEDLKFASTLLI